MGVTIQMKEIVAPFMIGIHYFVYQKHLAMLVLSNFSLVIELEMLLQAMYGFFSRSPKKFPEFQQLCDVFT